MSELEEHLPTAKSGSILRLCNRRYHHEYALAEGMERGVLGDRDGGTTVEGLVTGGRHE